MYCSQAVQGLQTQCYLLQVQGLQQNLFAAEVDTRRVTETLETVMQSHQQLQMTVEQLQTELGNKDAVISQLKSQMWVTVSLLVVDVFLLFYFMYYRHSSDELLISC